MRKLIVDKRWVIFRFNFILLLQIKFSWGKISSCCIVLKEGLKYFNSYYRLGVRGGLCSSHTDIWGETLQGYFEDNVKCCKNVHVKSDKCI